jgi:uncharacterized protein (TIGR00162 family)
MSVPSKMTERPRRSIIVTSHYPSLSDPLLISGLPGVGFAGSIAVAHIIKVLKAQRFGEVYSPYFQDAAYSGVQGKMRRPTIELYSGVSPNGRNLVLLYGNAQPMTNYGQYEVSGKLLDQAQKIGCSLIISLAGLRREYAGERPQVFYAASGLTTADPLLVRGINALQGEIYGMAGLLVGLARLRSINAICLLAETLGLYPDSNAAKALLEQLSSLYSIETDLSDLAETTKEVAESAQSMSL